MPDYRILSTYQADGAGRARPNAHERRFRRDRRRELTEDGWKIYANLGELLRYKKPGGVDRSAASSSPK